MIIKIILLLMIFSSIGVYAKLMKYKVPKSAIFYAFLIPIVSFFQNIKIVNKCIKNSTSNKCISDVLICIAVYIKLQVYALRYFNIINSLNISIYGQEKVRFLQFLQLSKEIMSYGQNEKNKFSYKQKEYEKFLISKLKLA